MKSLCTPPSGNEGPSKCSLCGKKIDHLILDFGNLPIANALVSSSAKNEKKYPLSIKYCDACELPQLADRLPAETHFHSNYVYFSSHSQSWLSHCETYSEEIIEELSLKSDSLILEIASNDGYLLQFFKNKGFHVLGIEPSGNVAKVALERGINTKVDFFTEVLADHLVEENIKPDLIIANNVIAHVPELNDFVRGISKVLTDNAVLTCEVHYFKNLIEKKQFDAIYHEHYYYYTINAAQKLFTKHGMRLYKVRHLSTHGGSLRFYVCRKESSHKTDSNLEELLKNEREYLSKTIPEVDVFQKRVFSTLDNMKSYLEQSKSEGKNVVGFGAPAKAATILNAANITPDLLAYTVDSNPAKQGKFLPGVKIPIKSPDVLRSDAVDEIIIFPWNLEKEITNLCRREYSFKGKLLVFIPDLKIIEAING